MNETNIDKKEKVQNNDSEFGVRPVFHQKKFAE
jgi:hypothetical protein